MDYMCTVTTGCGIQRHVHYYWLHTCSLEFKSKFQMKKKPNALQCLPWQESAMLYLENA